VNPYRVVPGTPRDDVLIVNTLCIPEVFDILECDSIEAHKVERTRNIWVKRVVNPKNGLSTPINYFRPRDAPPN
jgi:hypothetical protein